MKLGGGHQGRSSPATVIHGIPHLPMYFMLKHPIPPNPYRHGRFHIPTRAAPPGLNIIMSCSQQYDGERELVELPLFAPRADEVGEKNFSYLYKTVFNTLEQNR